MKYKILKTSETRSVENNVRLVADEKCTVRSTSAAADGIMRFRWRRCDVGAVAVVQSRRCVVLLNKISAASPVCSIHAEQITYTAYGEDFDVSRMALFLVVFLSSTPAQDLISIIYYKLNDIQNLQNVL